MGDFTLGNGYGYWRGRKYDENAPFVGVYFVDPSKPEGLGLYRDFKELAARSAQYYTIKLRVSASNLPP
ncbi:MAG TPA: hypothetical protein VFT16_01030 [Candidatus Saccharimonadales bacterium]|nr:hypothetical protein [Candidatus Saccharimonadales bacterium]